MKESIKLNKSISNANIYSVNSNQYMKLNFLFLFFIFFELCKSNPPAGGGNYQSVIVDKNNICNDNHITTSADRRCKYV